MFNAVVEHLAAADATPFIVVPFSDPPGTCVVISPSAQPEQLSVWQQQLEHLHAADMATFYAQLENFLAAVQADGMVVQFAAVGLFGSQVLLVGKEVDIHVDRAGQTKVALAHSPDLAAVAGTFHLETSYQLGQFAKVTFAEPVAVNPVHKLMSKPKVPPVFKKIGRVFTKLKTVIWSLTHALSALPKKTKQAVVIVILGVVVVVSGVIGFHNWQQQQTKQRVTQLTQELQTKRQAAADLAATNPVQAKQQLEAISAEYEQLKNDQTLPESVRRQLGNQQTEVANQIAAIVAASELAPLATYFDLRLVQSDFLASRFALSNQTLLLLDPQPRKVMAIDLNTKTARMLPVGETDVLADLTTTSSKAYYLGKAILEGDLTSDAIPTQLKLDKTDLAADLIRQFNQNLYLFSRQNRSISRINLDEKADERKVQTWLKSGQPFEAEQVSDMAVDGDLWIATKDGRVLKFAAGTQEEFSLTGIADPPTSQLAIYTQEDLPQLFLLEPQKSRLLVVDKNGALIKEIRSSTLASATALVVNVAQQKIIILSGSQLFEIPFP